MIIYNKTWLDNLRVIAFAEKEHNEKFIPDAEFASIKLHYPNGFYSPNLFIRCGLFFLTLVISSCSSGFLSLLFIEAGVIDNYGWLIFLGIAHYVALEIIVRKKFHLASGVDDALLYSVFGLFVAAFTWATNSFASESYIPVAAFIFLLSTALSVRFSDRLMSLVSFVSLLALVFLSWKKIGTIGIATMPFFLMIFSALSYLLIKKVEKLNQFRHYVKCFLILEIATLTLFYLSGNYYAVKELGDAVSGTVSKSIPLGWIFWGWTFGVPAVYFYLGIKRKSLMLIRIGSLFFCTAVLTFRNYHHVLPTESAMILAGTLVLGLAYFITRYLKSPRAGFTSSETNYQDFAGKLNVESLVVNETFADAGQPMPEGSSRFGGGQFGGGGAESDF